jgi:hypothetical protein
MGVPVVLREMVQLTTLNDVDIFQWVLEGIVAIARDGRCAEFFPSGMADFHSS